MKSTASPNFTMVILTLINLLNYVDRWLVAAVIPSMQKDLSLSNTEAGLVMSAFMLGYFLTSPVFGYLADRKRRLNLVIGGTVAWSLATFFSGFGRSALQIFLARTAVGVGEASTVSSGQSLIGDLFPPGRRNQAMAYFTAAIPVGAALGFVIGGILEHLWGWRMTFFIAGLPGLFLALLLSFRQEPVRGNLDFKGSSQPIEASGFKSDIKVLLKNKGYVQAVFGYTAYTFTLGGFASWAASYLVKVREVPLTQADSLFGALTVITGTLGTLAGGYFSARAVKKDPNGDLKFLVFSTALAIPFAFGAFILANKVAFIFCIAVTEFLLFSGQPAVNVVIMEKAGPFLRGTATALGIFTIHLLGDFISPPLVGLIADKTSLQTGILILPTALFFAVYFYFKCYTTSRVKPIPSP